MSNNRGLNSPWAIGIGTTVLGVSLTFALGRFEGTPFLTTIQYFLNSLKIKIFEIFNFEIRVWWILVTIIIVLVLLALMNKNKSNKKNEQIFMSYTIDRFKKWEWTWNWKFDTSRRTWVVANMKAACPKCSSTLLESSDFMNRYTFECPKCDFYSYEEDNEHPTKIEQLILDKANRMKE